MTVVRTEINVAGFRELRTSAGVHRILEEQAEGMASRANAIPSSTGSEPDRPYYEVSDASDVDRARKRVHTTGARAARHEAKTQALQRSI